MVREGKAIWKVTGVMFIAGIFTAAAGAAAETGGCVSCHGANGKGMDSGIVEHWKASAHSKNDVGCETCHVIPAPGDGADIDNPRYVVKTRWDRKSGIKSVTLVKKDGKLVERPDIWKHNGSEVIVAVSPRTCAQCHEDAVREFFNSRHSSAAQFIGSVDNFLGRFAEGPAAANSGCQQCHGSTLRISRPASEAHAPKIAADTWPNTGIGRVNFDGSWGSCTACHSRHEFSSELARRPDNCGKCHMGPDHPQYEIYLESKHGIAFKNSVEDMNIDSPAGEWVLGEDYAQAPTCSTCHMGAVARHGKQEALELTHDVGARISWTLRPKISFKPKGIRDKDGNVILKDPDGRREDMKAVCTTCHSDSWVDNFYVQYDQVVELYNEKYGKPAVAIYEYLKKVKVIDSIPMNEEMDYVFFELWHHEGRRARHGAAMMGPDYVQWHGFYELTKNFYTHFLPLAKELAEKAGKGDAVDKFINATLHKGDSWEKYHKWTEGLSHGEKNALLEWEKRTYGDRE